MGLAALMLSRYDVTLLDEPTNDLDFDGLEHLERLVLGLPGGLMVVSHDREFLARTVNAVLEIDERTREASFFGGSWASYMQEKAALARHKEEAWDKYRQTRDDLLGRAQRERQWATSGVARGSEKRPLTRTKRSATSASTGPSNWPRGLGVRRKRWTAWNKWKNPGNPGISTTPCRWHRGPAPSSPRSPTRWWPKARFS